MGKRAKKPTAKAAAPERPPGHGFAPYSAGAHYDFHPFANAFPLMEGDEFDRLVERMRQRGYRTARPIVLWQGKILDGRNRWRAAKAAGVQPSFRIYDQTDEGDALEFVISENLDRRQLNDRQRALAAAALATLAEGRPRKGSEGFSRATVAGLLKVAERTLDLAISIKSSGSAGLKRLAGQGTLSLSAAAEVAQALAKGDQDKLAALGEKAILRAAKEIRGKKNAERRTERNARIITTSNCIAELRGARRYPLIYADPPWQYQMGDTDRSVDNHYPTMPLDDICALPVRELALDDSVLALWVPEPHLFCSAPAVLAAWGFTHKSGAVWDKVVPGMGHYFMVQHEHLLIGTRGSVPQPPENARPRSVITHKRTRKHSEKPNDRVMDMLERMYPQFFGHAEPLAIELFARSGRKGWACWGNQAPVQREAA